MLKYCIDTLTELFENWRESTMHCAIAFDWVIHKIESIILDFLGIMIEATKVIKSF